MTPFSQVAFALSDFAPEHPYRQQPRFQQVRDDSVQTLEVFKSLKGGRSKYYSDDGAVADLLSLSGTLPVLVHGVPYNIPVEIFVPPLYPSDAPLVFVRSTSTTAIKPGHESVDAGGKVSIAYLRQWHAGTNNLEGLCRKLVEVFGEEPPVHARPQVQAMTGGGGVASSGGGSSSSSSVVPQQRRAHAPPPAVAASPPSPAAMDLDSVMIDIFDSDSSSSGAAVQSSPLRRGGGGGGGSSYAAAPLRLSVQTTTLLSMVRGLAASRDRARDIASRTLPLSLLLAPRFESFGDSPKQKGRGGGVGGDEDEPTLASLLGDAGRAKDRLDGCMAAFLERSGLDPASAYKGAPLKTRESCTRKVRDDYKGDALLLCDICRCSVVVKSEEDLKNVLDELLKGGWGGVVVRLKNRFKYFLFTGIRDCLLNVEIELEPGGGKTHICEIQIHLDVILALKKISHTYYDFFREYFKGSTESYQKRVEAFDELCPGGFVSSSGDSSEMSGEHLISEILESSDERRLLALANLTRREMLGDYHVHALCRERLLSLNFGSLSPLEGLRLLHELADVYALAGDHEKAVDLATDVLRKSTALQGMRHMDTLAAAHNLAKAFVIRADSRDAYGDVLGDSAEDRKKAAKLFEVALKGREETIGKDHLDTVSSAESLAALRLAQRLDLKLGDITILEKFAFYICNFVVGGGLTWKVLGFPMLILIFVTSLQAWGAIKNEALLGLPFNDDVVVILFWFHHLPFVFVTYLIARRSDDGAVWLGQRSQYTAYIRDLQILEAVERALEVRIDKQGEDDPAAIYTATVLIDVLGGLAERNDRMLYTVKFLFLPVPILLRTPPTHAFATWNLAKAIEDHNEAQLFHKNALDWARRVAESRRKLITACEEKYGKFHPDTLTALNEYDFCCDVVEEKEREVTRNLRRVCPCCDHDKKEVKESMSNLKERLKTAEDQLGKRHETTRKIKRRRAKIRFEYNTDAVAGVCVSFLYCSLCLGIFAATGLFWYWIIAMKIMKHPWGWLG